MGAKELAITESTLPKKSRDVLTDLMVWDTDV